MEVILTRPGSSDKPTIGEIRRENIEDERAKSVPMCFGLFEEALFHIISDLGLVDRQDVGVAGELVVVELLVYNGVLCCGVFIENFLAYKDAMLAVGTGRQNVSADG
jgi:hypothetical protein